MIQTNIFKKVAIALCVGFLFFSTQSNAQIIYTDIVPDGNPTNGGFNFDQLGANEINYDTAYNTLDYTWTAGGTNIWANGNANAGWDVPKPLTAGTIIDANGNFIGQGDASMDDWGNVTPFPTNSDSYIGVRLKVGNNVYYGWMRVMWNGSQFIFKDYAYESTPNKSIKAGEKAVPTSLSQVDLSNQVEIFPNPTNSNISILNNTNTLINKAVIYDIYGHALTTIQINQTKQLIDVSHLSKGIYFISLYNDSLKVATKKYSIE